MKKKRFFFFNELFYVRINQSVTFHILPPLNLTMLCCATQKKKVQKRQKERKEKK